VTAVPGAFKRLGERELGLKNLMMSSFGRLYEALCKPERPTEFVTRLNGAPFGGKSQGSKGPPVFSKSRSKAQSLAMTAPRGVKRWKPWVPFGSPGAIENPTHANE
jgi:hypothetical protein